MTDSSFEWTDSLDSIVEYDVEALVTALDPVDHDRTGAAMTATAPAVFALGALDRWLQSSTPVRRLDVQWVESSAGWRCHVTAYEREPHPMLGWRDVPVLWGDGETQMEARDDLAERGVRAGVWR